MCFSATASFISGALLVTGGAVTVAKVKEKRELPFALIPVVFGVQQLFEGVVWVSFALPWLNSVTTFIYTFIAYVFWPIFAPLAILALEKNVVRRKILHFFVFLGIAVGLYLLSFLVSNPVSAEIIQNCIAYEGPQDYKPAIMVLYLLATCGSCIFSSYRMVNVFGVALGVAFLLAYFFFVFAFSSVWCFFAALLSVVVYLHFVLDKNK